MRTVSQRLSSHTAACSIYCDPGLAWISFFRAVRFVKYSAPTHRSHRAGRQHCRAHIPSSEPSSSVKWLVRCPAGIDRHGHVRKCLQARGGMKRPPMPAHTGTALGCETQHHLGRTVHRNRSPGSPPALHAGTAACRVCARGAGHGRGGGSCSGQGCDGRAGDAVATVGAGVIGGSRETQCVRNPFLYVVVWRATRLVQAATPWQVLGSRASQLQWLPNAPKTMTQPHRSHASLYRCTTMPRSHPSGFTMLDVQSHVVLILLLLFPISDVNARLAAVATALLRDTDSVKWGQSFSTYEPTNAPRALAPLVQRVSSAPHAWISHAHPLTHLWHCVWLPTAARAS